MILQKTKIIKIKRNRKFNFVKEIKRVRERIEEKLQFKTKERKTEREKFVVPKGTTLVGPK